MSAEFACTDARFHAALRGSPTRCARYIGRVGALAVALGVGVAVGTGQGMATARADDADPNLTDSSVTDPTPATGTATAALTDPTPPAEGKAGEEPKGEPSLPAPKMKLSVSGGAHILRELTVRKRHELKVADTERPKVDTERTQPTPPADEGDPDPTPRMDVPDVVKDVFPQRHSRPAPPSPRPVVQVDPHSAVQVAAQLAAPLAPRPPAARQPAPHLLTASHVEELATPALQQFTATVVTAPITTRTIAPPAAAAADPLGASAVLPGTRGSLVSRVAAVAFAPFLTPNPAAPQDPPLLLGVLAWARREIQRTFLNRTPQAVVDSVTTSEDVSATFDVLGNDVEPDVRDVKTVASYTQPAHGDLVLNDDSTFTYTPDANYNGPDSFTYTVTDQTSPWHVHGLAGLVFGGGHSSLGTATVNIAVGAANDPPTAPGTASVSTDEDTPVSGNLLTGAADLDGDDLDVSLAGDGKGTYGTLAVDPETGAFTYTPDANRLAAGQAVRDTFTYAVTDGTATTGATLTVNITGVNDPPVANPDTATTDEDTPVAINALANDTDPDSTGLTISTYSQPTNGTLTYNPTTTTFTFTYTPNTNFSGTDTFNYVATDGPLGSNATTVSIKVNRPPVAVADSYTVTQGTTLVANVLGNDSDPDGDAVSVSNIQIPASASVVIYTPEGVFSYVPKPDFVGTDTVSYTITDGISTSTSQITITVNPRPNTPPVIPDTDITLSTDLQTGLGTGDVGASDADNDPLSYSGDFTGDYGTLSVDTNGGMTYTPKAAARVDALALGARSDEFVVTVSDGRGGSAQATVTAKVAPYVGPQAAQLQDLGDQLMAQSARINQLRTEINALTAEIQQLSQQNPRDNALIQQKVVEQQNLIQQQANAADVYLNVISSINTTRQQILANV